MSRRNLFLTSESPSRPAGIDIRTILSTELRLLEPICTFTDHDGYSIYRSDLFRNYCGGNGVQIHDPRGLALKEWEDIFHEHFEPHLFEHTTFTFPLEETYASLMEEARAAGYHVELDAYMFVDSMSACRSLPEGFRIGKIKSEEEWRRRQGLGDRVSVDEDWYDPDVTEDRLFEKTCYTSERIGIEWFYICPAGSDEMMASLGIFEHNGICRLQDVQTDPAHRRRGLASALVSFAIGRAIETLDTKGLALCADSDYYAVDLYRNLGFIECGSGVTMMKYPVRNPIYLQAHEQ